MKRLLFIALLLISSQVSAASIQLGWDANTESNLAGYRVYQSNTGLRPFQVISSLHTQTSVTFSNISAGRPYYWAVTAYNSSGVESDYSNIVFMQQPLPPNSLVLIINGLIIRP